MAQQFNRTPQFPQPLVVRGQTSKDWYFFWDGLARGLAPGNVAPLTATGSPMEINPTAKGSVIVSGGTVSLIEFSRDGVAYYDTGQTAGMFTMNAQDRLRVTYSVTPTTLVYVPT